MSPNITFLKEWIRSNPNTDLTIGILTDAMESFKNNTDVTRLRSVYICNHIRRAFRTTDLLMEYDEFIKLGYDPMKIHDIVEDTIALILKYRPTSKLFPEIYNHPKFIKHDDKYLFNSNMFWDIGYYDDLIEIPKSILLQKVEYLKLLINMLTVTGY